MQAMVKLVGIRALITKSFLLVPSIGQVYIYGRKEIFITKHKEIYMDEINTVSTEIAKTVSDSLIFTEVRTSKKFNQREYVAQILRQFGPYRFFGTLSYQYPLSFWQAEQFASLHARDVTKILFGKRRKKGFLPLEGIVVLEKASLFSDAQWDNPHFHYLIKDHQDLPRDDEAALQLLSGAFTGATRRLVQKNVYRKGRKKPEDRSLVSKTSGILVKLTDERDYLCWYLSKESTAKDWDWVDRIYHLGKDGLES